MIGIIVTGHGRFASGLTSSIDLIAGPQKEYIAVDFDGTSTKKLEDDLKLAISKLESNDGILIFTDLVGGSPFKTACILTYNNPKIRVIAGSNLAMLCELTMSRLMDNDLKALTDKALDVGKKGILVFETFNDDDNNIDNISSDGI